MPIAFISNLIETLKVLDFHPLSTPDGYLLLKQEHSHLYLINIVETQGPLAQRKQMEEAYIQQIQEGIARKIRANRFIVLQLYVAQTHGDEINEQLGQDEFDPDAEICLIPWLVDLETKTLRIPPNQPTEILQMNTLIQGILQPEADQGAKLFQPLKQKSNDILFTLSLIAINGILWLLMELAGGSTDHGVLLKFGANEVGKILHQKQYWRLLTSTFLHIGVMHLLFNNLSLYIFGSRVEKYFGKKKYLLIYLLSGLAGSVGSVAVSYAMGVNILSAGASGAIYGMLGATFALGQKTKRQIDHLSAYTMALMIISGLAMGFMSPNIDNTAHLAGLVTGYLLGRSR